MVPIMIVILVVSCFLIVLFAGHIIVERLSAEIEYDEICGLLNIPRLESLPDTRSLSKAIALVCTDLEEDQRGRIVELIDELASRVSESKRLDWQKSMLKNAIRYNWPIWAITALPGDHQTEIGVKGEFFVVLQLVSDWFPADWIAEFIPLSQDQIAIKFADPYKEVGQQIVSYFNQIQRELPTHNEELIKGALVADIEGLIGTRRYEEPVVNTIRHRVSTTRKELLTAGLGV